MAFENALDAKPRAFQRAIALDRLIGVARARRFEATLREHQMRQRQLVPANACHYDQARQSLQPHGRHVSVSTTPANSARSTANEAVYAERLARITRSMAGRARTTSR